MSGQLLHRRGAPELGREAVARVRDLELQLLQAARDRSIQVRSRKWRLISPSTMGVA